LGWKSVSSQSGHGAPGSLGESGWACAQGDTEQAKASVRVATNQRGDVRLFMRRGTIDLGQSHGNQRDG